MAAIAIGLRSSRRRLLGEALALAAALSLLFVAVYGSANALAVERCAGATAFFDWELRAIPFVPIFVVPYFTIDLFFVGSFPLCRTRRELRRHAARIALAILAAGVCFVAFPLTVGFPRPDVSGATGLLFRFLWGFDIPHNLVPSLHVALLLLLWPVYRRRSSGLARFALDLWFAAIGLSTLLTWQHHVVDVVTGAALGGLCHAVAPDASCATTAPEGRNRAAAKIFACGALVLASVACFARGWWPLAAWPAAALAVVAIAYSRGEPRLFAKRGGRLSLASILFFAPYLAGAWLYRLGYRLGVPPYVVVAPGLVVGRRLGRRDAERLRRTGIAAVLDLTAETSESGVLRDLVYRNVPMLDLTRPSVAALDASCEFVERHRAGGVYVHCALGFSRSVVVAAACLVRSGEAATAADAVASVLAARPEAIVHPRMTSALAAYERELRRRRAKTHAPPSALAETR